MAPVKGSCNRPGRRYYYGGELWLMTLLCVGSLILLVVGAAVLRGKSGELPMLQGGSSGAPRRGEAAVVRQQAAGATNVDRRCSKE
jgi:hypothetical protein